MEEKKNFWLIGNIRETLYDGIYYRQTDLETSFSSQNIFVCKVYEIKCWSYKSLGKTGSKLVQVFLLYFINKTSNIYI